MEVSNSIRNRMGRNGVVAVAIDGDGGSQLALKWASENLITKGQTVILIHVVHKSTPPPFINNSNETYQHDAEAEVEQHTKELFLPFHCFCYRNDFTFFDVVLEDTNIAKAITDYVAHAAIENLVLGAASHRGYNHLRTVYLPVSVSKTAPDFCTVYVISSKGYITSVRNAVRVAPFESPLMTQIQQPIPQSTSRINCEIIRSDQLMKNKPQ